MGGDGSWVTILRLSSCSGEGSVGWNWDRLTALRQGHWEDNVAKGDFAHHASQKTVLL